MGIREDLEKLDNDLEQAEKEYQYRQRDLLSAMMCQSEHMRRVARRQMQIKVDSDEVTKESCSTKIHVFKADVERFDILDEKVHELSNKREEAYEDLKLAIEAIESYYLNKIP